MEHMKSQGAELRRWASVLAGLALIGVAAIAATRVENSRAGLIAEIIMYLSVVAGLVLLFYGIYAGRSRGTSVRTESSQSTSPEPQVRSANDLVLGTAGIVLAIALLSGLAISGGMLWATFGFILLLPMLVGSLYLSQRFLRAPSRDWRVELRPFRNAARQKKHSDHDQSSGPDEVPVDKSQVVSEKKKTNHDQDQAERD